MNNFKVFSLLHTRAINSAWNVKVAKIPFAGCEYNIDLAGESQTIKSWDQLEKKYRFACTDQLTCVEVLSSQMQSCLSEIVLVVNVCNVAVLQSPLNNCQFSPGRPQKHQVVAMVVWNMKRVFFAHLQTIFMWNFAYWSCFQKSVIVVTMHIAQTLATLCH